MVRGVEMELVLILEIDANFEGDSWLYGDFGDGIDVRMLAVHLDPQSREDGANALNSLVESGNFELASVHAD